MPYKNRDAKNTAARKHNARPEVKAVRAEFDRKRRLDPGYLTAERAYSREYMRERRKDAGYREAGNARTRQYRQEHPEETRSRQRIARVTKRERVTQLKAGRPCADCGHVFHPVCMDWDHLPGTVKSFCISKEISRPMEEILKEIAKCQLVCANCHRIRTLVTRK